MDVVPPRVFLERRSYRMRRVMDAQRLMPILGIVLWLVPALWPTQYEISHGTAAPDAAPVAMSVAILYVFAVWCVLIGLSAWISWWLSRNRDAGETGALYRDAKRYWAETGTTGPMPRAGSVRPPKRLSDEDAG